MKKIIFFFLLVFIAGISVSAAKNIKLNPPSKTENESFERAVSPNIKFGISDNNGIFLKYEF